MQPVRLFPDNRSASRLERPPSSAGMVPVSEFRLRSKCVSPNSRPRYSGMLPSSPSLASSSRVTRLGVPLTVTPSHAVMVVVAFQLRVAVPRQRIHYN